MIRLILVFIIIALIVRAFIITGLESRKERPAYGNSNPKGAWKFKKGVFKGIGEYIDYEEIKKKN